MHAKVSKFAVAAVFFVLTACGGGGSGGGDSSGGLGGDGTELLSGFLIGPRTQGLTYGSSTTTASGEFSYTSGASLDFNLGGLALGAVTARTRLSLYDLVGAAEQYRFNKAVRVGQLLFSLDSDSNAGNGVQLDNTAATAGEVEWQASNSLWQAAASSLIYRLSNGTQNLVDADHALQTITERLRGEGESCRADLVSTAGFSISDPRCSDRERMALWRDGYKPALQNLQDSVDQLLDQQVTTRVWWSGMMAEVDALGDQSDKIQAWVSYALAGADVPLREAVQDSLASGGDFDSTLQDELERWRIGGGLVMRARDGQERLLTEKVLDTWLSYGFDQQAMLSAMGLDSDSAWDEFIRAAAARAGVSTTQLRLAVVDQQVYLALQAMDAQMQQSGDWVTGGSAINDNTGTGGGSGDGSGVARVWRVAYETLTTGTSAQFTVEGSGLDEQVSLVLAGCADLQALSGTESQRIYHCELSGDAGGRVLQVIDSSDGSLLYEAIVRVEAGSGPGETKEPVVSGVSPVTAERSSTQLFTVTGTDFPLDMRFTLAGCSGAQVQSRSSTLVQVLCQLDDRATVRSGSIALADGSEIYQFYVSPTQIEEPEIEVVGMQPAAALESDTLEITLSGSGFGNSAQVQSSACDNITLISRTDAQITFRCTDAQLGTWPVHVVSSQQTVLAPQSFQVRAVEASVSSVSPLLATEGEWFNLKIAGALLGEGVRVELGACSEFELLDSTPVLRQFGCTPQTPGLYQGRVLAGEEVLYRFDFTVEEADVASDVSVSPRSSSYGEPLQLVFSGQSLDELAQVEMESCYNMALLSASASELRFSCTPQMVGSLDGRLEDRDGALLLAFSVTIVDDSNPIEGVVIDEVVPASTYLDVQTTFTVRGEELPASLVLSVEDCTEVQAMGGHSSQRQFRCTPRGTGGVRQISVYASAGGELLGSFDLQVTGNEMRVTSVTPEQTTIGVNTIFRVTGQNLSSAMVLDLEGCDARLMSSSSTEQRSYRCVPYGRSGTRTIRVRDRLGGTVLYTGSLNLLGAT